MNQHGCHNEIRVSKTFIIWQKMKKWILLKIKSSQNPKSPVSLVLGKILRFFSTFDKMGKKEEQGLKGGAKRVPQKKPATKKVAGKPKRKPAKKTPKTHIVDRKGKDVAPPKKIETGAKRE